ncbi:hypothetical protein [Micromonospora sp. ATA51]|uniref:hypothetical protein n=1 Tax=Micromonospora sp. ATA51 TaxID=2806098 RepID=UPI001EE3B05C|nr:hypothetical protein [Micromonospora sp. ATA51]
MPNRSDTPVITPALLRDWALPVPTGGKEHRGRVLVVGGSRFTPGAVLLAGVAALRAAPACSNWPRPSPPPPR